MMIGFTAGVEDVQRENSPLRIASILDVSLLMLQARSDPSAVQAMANAIRRQVPSGDLWHAALMQVRGFAGLRAPMTQLLLLYVKPRASDSLQHAIVPFSDCSEHSFGVWPQA